MIVREELSDEVVHTEKGILKAKSKTYMYKKLPINMLRGKFWGHGFVTAKIKTPLS